MRAQYSAQYNFTIQRNLTKDMKFEIGYVGSQGHRLLATHDLNYGNAQTCLELQTLQMPIRRCRPHLWPRFYADSFLFHPIAAIGSCRWLCIFRMGPKAVQVIPAGTSVR